MKSRSTKIHFDAPGVGYSNPPCGVYTYGYATKTTTDVTEVTCKSCKNTAAYRDAKSKLSGGTKGTDMIDISGLPKKVSAGTLTQLVKEHNTISTDVRRCGNNIAVRAGEYSRSSKSVILNFVQADTPLYKMNNFWFDVNNIDKMIGHLKDVRDKLEALNA